MSPSLLAILQRIERDAQRDASHCRRMYLRTGMSPEQARYYGARRNWADACQQLARNGAGPFRSAF